MEPDFLDPSAWMDTQDLAVLLNKAVATLEGARSRGADHPPFYKHCGTVRYLRSDVIAWLKSRRHVTPECRLRNVEATAA